MVSENPDHRILDVEEFKDALRVLAKWRGEGGHDMADAWDAATGHDEALRSALSEAERERDTLRRTRTGTALDRNNWQDRAEAAERALSETLEALREALDELERQRRFGHGEVNVGPIDRARALLVSLEAKGEK